MFSFDDIMLNKIHHNIKSLVNVQSVLFVEFSTTMRFSYHNNTYIVSIRVVLTIDIHRRRAAHFCKNTLLERVVSATRVVHLMYGNLRIHFMIETSLIILLDIKYSRRFYLKYCRLENECGEQFLIKFITLLRASFPHNKTHR